MRIPSHSYSLMICYGDGQVEPIDIQGLIDCLAEDSLIRNSYVEPWVLEKVVESILHHFRVKLHRQGMSLAELVDLTRTLLADFSKGASLPNLGLACFDLFQLARRYDAGFELGFFSEIRRFFVEKDVKTIYFTGLRRCAKYLSGHERWSRRCSEIRDEIVACIRQEAVRAKMRDFILSISS